MTHLERRPQKKLKMEDDLKKNENGRRPQFVFEKLKWRPQTKMEDDLKKNKRQPKKIKNRRRPQQKWKTTFKKIEENLKKDGRRTNQLKST